MKPASEVTALILDTGLFVEFAAKLAQTFKRTIYYVPPDSGLPKVNRSRIGYGYEGLELVTDLFEVPPSEIDLYCALDVGFGYTQSYLASIGKPVWGCRESEALEFDRVWTKELMEDEGLPVGKFEVVEGMKALREYLRKHENVFVKVDRWRGTCESFHSKDYKFIEPRLDELEHNLGSLKYIQPFIVEDALDEPDMVEYGTDLITMDGINPKVILSGLELKDSLYVGRVQPFANIPEPLTRWNVVMAKYLKELHCRGPISNEIRIGKKHLPHMIDATLRLPAPPNELYQEMIKNLASIVWNGANGIVEEPDWIAPFGAQAIGFSNWADQNCQIVDFPAKLRNHVKLHNGAKINGSYVVIPMPFELSEVCAVVAWGDTMDDAIEKCKDICDEVTGFGLSFPTEKFASATEEIEKLDKIGLGIF